ncbi:reverse transcriptase domain-containing protein [Tanacetum coccineum]
MLPKFSQIVNRLYAFIYETNHSKSGLGLPSIVALVMVIDKSWTSLGKHEKAFYTGLKKFVDDCKPLVDSAGNIRCPCKSCRLVLWVSIKHLSDHISKYGFDPSYKTWIHHGEPDLPPPPPVIDNTRQPQMSDMTACLNDLSYIPLNNEQNEPTQGDIGETSNDPTQAKRNEFKELYASANEELYPGCDHVTRLDFMAKFTYFKVKGKLTDSIFNEMLEFFQNVFPTAKGYKLLPSYYAIKKTFKTIGLGYESIHACVNDCFLFRGDANKDVHFCLVCNTSRWKDSNTPGKKVPKKVLRYFPIIPRLQCLYKSSHTAKEMTWHATGKTKNVRLGLAADGFNPFGNLSQSYNMWLVILTTYNLPPWLCMKESSFMLTLLNPGPKSPGKDIDVYLRSLIDDLKVLWAKPGVETIDVATGLKFNMRAMVLWTINDFPARSSLSKWSGQGYRACPTCNEDTPSVRVLGKTTYVGHRRFLKKPHKWRRSLEFNGETKNGDPPREFSQDAIMTQLARLPTRVKGKHPRFGAVKIKRNLGKNENGKCSKPQAAYSFTPEDRRKFCQFIKGVKLPDGFGSNFKHKVTDNDTNQYLPPDIAKPLIELCLFFKQICSQTLMVDDMLKAQSKIRQRHVDNDPGVRESSELFALACGPSQTPIPVNSCIINGVRFVVHSRDERRTTQNSGIYSPGPDREMYYGQLEQILEFLYLLFKTVLFRVKWFDTSNKGRIQNFVIRNNITQIKANGEAFKNDQYILATQVKQCFYLEDMARRPLGWKVVEHVSHKKFLNGGVIMVEDDPDVIHVDNSSDLALSTSLIDLEITALHIDGQSIDVDAPPDIIDVVDEDDDIIDEEDPIPHDLADFDDEDLVNLDIDDGMSADVARGHSGDGGGDDRPPSHHIPTGYEGCLGNQAGRQHTRQETRNLGLKAITDKSGPVSIRFEFGDKETLMPLGEHAAHWANYLRELVRELTLHYPSWRQVPAEQRRGSWLGLG